MIIFIRSTIFNVFLAVWTLFITTLFLPTLITRNQKIISITASVWSEVLLVAMKLICNIDYKIEGHTHLVISEPVIVVSKHQSMWETVYLMKLFKKPVFILKKELTNIPFYGWYLIWMGMIAIKRDDGINALKYIIKQAKKSFAEKRNLIIFPEGRRVKPGEIIDIQPGIAAIKKAFPEIPIIPISVDSGKFWRKGEWLKYPGTIHLYIGEPICDIKIYKDDLLKKIKNSMGFESHGIKDGGAHN